MLGWDCWDAGRVVAVTVSAVGRRYVDVLRWGLDADARTGGVEPHDVNCQTWKDAASSVQKRRLAVVGRSPGEADAVRSTLAEDIPESSGHLYLIIVWNGVPHRTNVRVFVSRQIETDG